MRATPFEHDELERFSRGDLTDAFGNGDGTIARQLADEVLYQRKWMARVARIIEVQCLDMPKLAKCRREALEGTVLNLRDLVRGKNLAAIPARLESEYKALLEPARVEG